MKLDCFDSLHTTPEKKNRGGTLLFLQKKKSINRAYPVDTPG